jgi:hypothetical protein
VTATGVGRALSRRRRSRTWRTAAGGGIRRERLLDADRELVGAEGVEQLAQARDQAADVVPALGEGLDQAGHGDGGVQAEHASGLAGDTLGGDGVLDVGGVLDDATLAPGAGMPCDLIGPVEHADGVDRGDHGDDAAHPGVGDAEVVAVEAGVRRRADYHVDLVLDREGVGRKRAQPRLLRCEGVEHGAGAIARVAPRTPDVATPGGGLPGARRITSPPGLRAGQRPVPGRPLLLAAEAGTAQAIFALSVGASLLRCGVPGGA